MFNNWQHFIRKRNNLNDGRWKHSPIMITLVPRHKCRLPPTFVGPWIISQHQKLGIQNIWSRLALEWKDYFVEDVVVIHLFWLLSRISFVRLQAVLVIIVVFLKTSSVPLHATLRYYVTGVRHCGDTAWEVCRRGDAFCGILH